MVFASSEKELWIPLRCGILAIQLKCDKTSCRRAFSLQSLHRMQRRGQRLELLAAAFNQACQ